MQPRPSNEIRASWTAWCLRALIFGSLVLPVVFSFVPYKTRWPAYDYFNDYVNGITFLRHGVLPLHGSMSSSGALNPPGFFLWYLPGQLLFGREPGAVMALAACLPFLLSQAGLLVLLRGRFSLSVIALTLFLYTFSKIGGTLWNLPCPRGHPAVTVWVLVFLLRWGECGRRRDLLLSGAIYFWGCYSFLEVLPLFLAFPIVAYRSRRRPAARDLIWLSVLFVAIWSPYLLFQYNRSFQDLLSLLSRIPLDPEMAGLPRTLAEALRAETDLLVFWLEKRSGPYAGFVLIPMVLAGTLWAMRGVARIPGAPGEIPSARTRGTMARVFLACWLLLLLAMYWDLIHGSYGAIDAKRAWWLWPLNSLFLSCFIIEVLPELTRKKAVAWAAAAAAMYLIVPAGEYTSAANHLIRHGYGGMSDRRDALDELGKLVAGRGRSSAAIGYGLCVSCWHRKRSGEWRFKQGADYDLFLAEHFGITNLTQRIEGHSPEDEFRLVQRCGREGWCGVQFDLEPDHRFVEAFRKGNYRILARR